MKNISKMNYQNNMQYSLFSVSFLQFDEMVEALLGQISQENAVFRLVFFGKNSDNKQYVERRSIIEEKVKQYYSGQIPAVNYVSQPSLNGALTLEVHSYKKVPNDRISYRSCNGIPYVVLENSDGRFLFISGLHGNVLQDNILNQSEEIFQTVANLLKTEDFPIKSIVRQWNYIENIIKFDGEDQHYQMFNNARSSFYDQETWSEGYPAATGIGTVCGGVSVDLDAVVFKKASCSIKAIDNKLQVAAHVYSEEVLEAAYLKKSTPKFERAKSLNFTNGRMIYISGTAAIRGEKSIENGNLEAQIRITMENIAQLTQGGQLNIIRVYLKDKSSYIQAQSLLNDSNPGIPIAYLQADVCRDELLVEIEGIATETIDSF